MTKGETIKGLRFLPELRKGDKVEMSEQYKKAEKGLACCERRGYCEGHCPYYESEKGALECTSELAHDALALISKQKERIRELEAAEKVPVKYPTCGCCGKEIDHINTSVFNYDGSDSDVSIPVIQEPSGGGVSFETNRNWTDYELTDEERKDGIRCPYCGKYPFDRDTEIELFEPVCVMMWPVSKNPEESHDI